MLEAAHGGEFERRVNPELMQSVLEIATPVCRTAAEVEVELRKLRAYVTGIAREQGMRVGSAGTHPFSLFERQRITARDRYRNLVDQMQYVARRELIFGMHVHVAVDDPEKAIQVVNGLLVHVPLLLALSANSPFCQGRDSGFASMRTAIFQGFPRTGTARWFGDYSTYIRAVDALVASGALPDPSFLWWDVRLQPRLGTVEVRVMDSQSTVADSTPRAMLGSNHSISSAVMIPSRPNVVEYQGIPAYG